MPPSKENGFARQMRIAAEYTADWPDWMKEEASRRFGDQSSFNMREKPSTRKPLERSGFRVDAQPERDIIGVGDHMQTPDGSEFACMGRSNRGVLLKCKKGLWKGQSVCWRDSVIFDLIQSGAIIWHIGGGPLAL